MQAAVILCLLDGGYGGNRRGLIIQDAPTDFLQNLPHRCWLLTFHIQRTTKRQVYINVEFNSARLLITISSRVFP